MTQQDCPPQPSLRPQVRALVPGLLPSTSFLSPPRRLPAAIPGTSEPAMTAADVTGDGLAAALIQISAHAERISVADAREAAHYDDLVTRLGDLASQVTALTAR